MISQKQFIYIILSIYSISTIYSQSDKLGESIIADFIGQHYDRVDKKINRLNSLELKSSYKLLSQILINSGRRKKKDSFYLNSFRKIVETNTFINTTAKGYYSLFYNNSKKASLKYFNQAYEEAKENKNLIQTKFALIGLLELYNNQFIHTSTSHSIYLKELKSLSNTFDDFAIVNYYEAMFHIKAIKYREKATGGIYGNIRKIVLNDEISSSLKAKNLEILSVYYRINNKKDSMLYYFKKLEKTANKPYNETTIFNTYMEIAAYYARENDKKRANKYLVLAREAANKSDTLKSFYSLDRFKSFYVHEPLKQYDSAFNSLKRVYLKEAYFNFRDDNLAISELNTELRTAEKEKQILIEQEQKKRFRNSAISLGSLLILGSIVFFLIQKNTKRKQLLAEQEKELESQKVTTLLKEQELTAIDAMIEGQEKERQRIANDLHDDLGGLMATVKLHFNALKEKQSPELYNKTNALLDEAYNKVRSVAHAKNSGVMAKKGLLKALNDMAKTVSASNQLQVDIVDHGLDERLENSLELTIFRIVQELITNIIKHAEASEASVHITKHDDSLNIMVEDNGKGFDTKNIDKNSGMGIHSIDKRIENLDGNVTIESEIHKGTTVIIDIPT